MSTRKRGRVSNKKIYGGVGGWSPGPAPTGPAAGNNFTRRAREGLAAVGSAIGSGARTVGSGAQRLGTAVRSGTQAVGSAIGSGARTVGSKVASGASAVRSGTQSVGSRFSSSSTIAPSPAAGKIKPDNLLVPMVINLEQNKVLLGYNIYPIENGTLSDDDNNKIKIAYNDYIAMAKQQILPNPTPDDAEPTNDEINRVVRNIVKEEFLTIIKDLLTAKNLESVKDFANNANVLGMDDDGLFSDILCIISSRDNDDAKIQQIYRVLPRTEYEDDFDGQQSPRSFDEGPSVPKFNIGDFVETKDGKINGIIANNDSKDFYRVSIDTSDGPRLHDMPIDSLVLQKPKPAMSESFDQSAQEQSQKNLEAQRKELEKLGAFKQIEANRDSASAVGSETRGGIEDDASSLGAGGPSGSAAPTTQFLKGSNIVYKDGDKTSSGEIREISKKTDGNNEYTIYDQIDKQAITLPIGTQMRPINPGELEMISANLSNGKEVNLTFGGARRLKKTRKHRKRSKRKTAHYLRIK